MYYGYVYKTTNLINGKVYVGQKKREYRLGQHPTYLGSGRMIRDAVEKYGEENFSCEVLEWVTEDEACERERYWIQELNSLYTSGKGYNMTVGGIGGGSVGKYNCFSAQNWDKHGENNPFYGKRHTEETKKRISRAKKGSVPPNKGKTYTGKEYERLYVGREFEIECYICGNIFIASGSGAKYCEICNIQRQIDEHKSAIKRLTAEYAINNRKEKIEVLEKELHNIKNNV